MAKARTFKFETRRVNKDFPLDSYETSSALGALLLEQYPHQLTVKMLDPDFIFFVEIRDKIYLYHITEGAKGTACRHERAGILLLSGGIDSPVAGYMMASRGMILDAIYFHTFPESSGLVEGGGTCRTFGALRGADQRFVCGGFHGHQAGK